MKLVSVRSLVIFLLICPLVSLSQNATVEKSMTWYTSNAPFKMNDIPKPTIPGRIYNIDKYGAVGDGQTLNTQAFSKAIGAAVTAGGGKVVVPAGLWLTGPIRLESNINLEVQRGAIIVFTKDHKQYPIIKAGNSSGLLVASPIYAFDAHDIAITGEGIIDGGGDSWRPVKKIKTTAAQWKELNTSGVVSKDGSVWWPSEEAINGEEYLKKLKEQKTPFTEENNLPARDFLRPYMCYLVHCENILIENVTMRNSPKFVFYPNNCTNLIMDHVNIFNEWWAQNGDGIDISASKNVMIYKCNVSAGDDGICMKSSGKSSSSEANLQNVIVAACNVYHAHGGFVIGSNTDGQIENVFVKDCNFIGTDIGIRVKSNAGRGGLVHHIYINNIYMNDIVNEAILFDTYYEDVPAGKTKVVSKAIREKTPEFKDFFITDVYCKDAKTAISITGLPEMPVHDIYFKNITISAANGVIATDAAALSFDKTIILASKEPIFTFHHTIGATISSGYFPPSGKSFIKKDNTSSGININDPLIKQRPGAVEEYK